MEQTISIQNRLRPDEGQAYLLPIAVASETLSTTSASKINVRDEGLTVLSDSANPVAE